MITTVADESELRDELAGAGEVRVVAPAAKVSRLAWLTGAEDDARAEADRAAQSAAEAALGQSTWLEDDALRKAVEEAGTPLRHLELQASS